MGGVCSAEAQAESDAAVAAAMSAPPSNSACDTLLAKLDELMDFLRFAKLPTANFHGVVRLCVLVLACVCMHATSVSTRALMQWFSVHARR